MENLQSAVREIFYWKLPPLPFSLYIFSFPIESVIMAFMRIDNFSNNPNLCVYQSTASKSNVPSLDLYICSPYLILTSRQMCEAYMNQAENCLWISDIWNDGWFKKLISSIFMVVIKLFCIITNVESGTWWIWHSNLKHFLKSYFSISLLMNPPAIFLNFHHALTFVTRCSHRCHLTTN